MCWGRVVLVGSDGKEVVVDGKYDSCSSWSYIGELSAGDVILWEDCLYPSSVFLFWV